MIQRIVYITALQIVLYTLGIPMLVAYEVGAQRLQAINNRTASVSSQVQSTQSLASQDSRR
jgi:hypothetical protein